MDGYDLDAEILAERVSGGVWMDRRQIAQALGVNETSVWQMVRRGKLPKPARIDRDATNHTYSLWSASQHAKALKERAT